MTFKREALKKDIIHNLACLSTSIKQGNTIGLFDANREVQPFFATLLKLVHGYENLKDLDTLSNSLNYPAIDLGDLEKKVAFQITTQSGSQKINDTIEKFIKHELYNNYDRLIIVIIGEKQAKYSVTFDTKSKFIFNKETDIWDDNSLVKAINNLEDIATLTSISQFLENELHEYKFPDSLTDYDETVNNSV